jgi:hypothetical protein
MERMRRNDGNEGDKGQERDVADAEIQTVRIVTQLALICDADDENREHYI